MKTRELSNIAEITLSGIDKKTKTGQKIIKLCNFTDVYYNWDLTNVEQQHFMQASASDKEIQELSLKRGDVCITKDSETRDDIGISCLISDDLSNTVLGYHCALIRPNENIVLGSYLNAFLKTKVARKYFSNQSSGSGQRYTLTKEGIGAVKITFPDLPQQLYISTLFDNICKKIRINNQINDNLQQVILTIFNRWFNQFEFDLEEGKTYSSSRRNFVFNSILKKEIPEGWIVENIAQNKLSSLIDVGVDYFTSKNYIATANVNGTMIQDGNDVTYENRESRANMQPSLNSIWFAKMKNSVKHIFISSNSQWFLDKYILSTGFCGIKCTELSFPYIASVIMQPYFEAAKDKMAHGATQQAVNNEDLKNIPLLVPSDEVLQKYSKIVLPIFKKMNEIQLENQKLMALRDNLLPLLMNGQVTIR